jgi:hypothetical protein
MLTCSGSHDRPSRAIRPSAPKVIAGSLLPVESACGAVVNPAGGLHVEISNVFEKAGDASTDVVVPTAIDTMAVATTTKILKLRRPGATAHLRERSTPRTVRQQPKPGNLGRWRPHRSCGHRHRRRAFLERPARRREQERAQAALIAAWIERTEYWEADAVSNEWPDRQGVLPGCPRRGYTQSKPVGLTQLMIDQGRAGVLVVLGAACQLLAVVLTLGC